MEQQLFKTLEVSRIYTLEVVEAMPENLYEFRPANSVRSFKEQVRHILYGIKWWEDNYISKLETEWNPPSVDYTKNELIKNLNLAYESLKKTMLRIGDTDARIPGFYATLDHITHHRAQVIIYLRCNSIAPPEYKF